MFCGGLPALTAIPDGYAPGRGAWVIPIRAGRMSSFAQSGASLTGFVMMAAGRNIDGSTSILINAPNAALQLIVSASGLATLALTGTGALAGALAASGSAAFSFVASPALLGAIAGLTATAGVTLSQTAVLTAIGRLAGDILPYTELSPQALADAVWGRIIESTHSAEAILRLLAAVAAGDATGLSTNPSFTGINGSTTRVAGTISGGTRTITTRNGA